MSKKSTMRRGQMIAIAALFTSAVAPYAVSADSVTTTSTEVTTTATASTYVEKGVDITVSTGNEATDAYTKAFFTNVDLEIASDGKKYAVVTLGDKSYAYPTLTDANGQEINIISQTGSADTKDWVRTFKLALDENYQAKFVGGGTRATNFTIDLAHEKFDFGFDTSLPDNNSYFKLWTPNADVVTLKDGKKVAYVTFAGHSYGVSSIFEGTDNSKAAQVVTSNGSAATKDLTRVIRLALDGDNKASAFLDGGERGSYTFTFDFTQKNAVANFVTAADVSTATALKVEYAAVDTTAGSWHPMAFSSAAANPVAKAVNGKIQVTYDLTKVKSFKATQDGKDVAVTVANNKATFTVNTLEGLAFEVTAESERNGAVTEATYKVSLTKAQAGDAVVEETPTTSIPTTTDVKGKKATVSFKASSDSLNSYFQKGFFGGVEIVEIGGQTYADLNIIEKSIGLEYDYIMPNGTKADVAEISGNRATQNGNYEGFSAIIRIPVAVDDKGAFTFTLDTVGGQPGTGSSAAYQFTFTGKIQNNVALPFTDLKNAATKEYVQQLANWGALNLDNKKFNPGNDMTRAQFSLMIARALDLKPTKTTQFKDVAKLTNKETKDAIQALYEAGVVKGKTATTFEPNTKISRQDAAVMLYRLMTKKLNYKATATVNDLNFNDAGDIKSSEAQLAFAELQKAGIMTGNQGFINPGSKLTRGQMAKILVESLNKTGFEK